MGNMLNKIKTYVAFLWKRLYFIKLFFIIFTLLLLYKEYEVFIFEKPTSVSMEEKMLEPNMPLDIIISSILGLTALAFTDTDIPTLISSLWAETLQDTASDGPMVEDLTQWIYWKM